jgi:hypothetical protein
MKTGRDLQTIAVQLDEQRRSRKDYLAPTTKLRVEGLDALRISGLNGDPLGFTSLALGQVAQDLDIPKKYFDRMASQAPDLLAANVNHWLQATERMRLVRVLGGNVRAWLTNAYRPLDNIDLLGAAMPALRKSGCQIVSSELTETRFYIKAILPGLERTVTSKRGDIVQAGVVIRNSEVGHGALSVDPFAYILACLNGATFADERFRRAHLGKRAEEDAQVRELLTTEARQADDQAFWLKVRDVVAAAFDEVRFDRLVTKMNESTETPALRKHESTVALITDVTASFGIPESERDPILEELIKGGDLSTWGLSNAITARSQQVEDYELATAMERAGGQIIELPRSQWSREEVAA